MSRYVAIVVWLNLSVGCVEPQQQGLGATPGQILTPTTDCHRGDVPVAAPVGGVHPKESSAEEEYPRYFDEDPLCASGGAR